MDSQLTLFDRVADYLESSTQDFDGSNASFRVHASLIYKLGESLIADEVTALSELIKNAYDADARICTLSIDSDYSETIDGKECKGKIELTDNGSGMDLNTIINGWLTLSNSPKKKMKKEKRTTPKYHRYPLGDKGLGRLSVQKLGRYMQMTTKAENSQIEYCVIIPWGDFLKNTTIDQIPVKICQKAVDSDKSYTKIVIKDLLDPQAWGKEEQINLLTNSINKIVSPFRAQNNSFRVVAKINDRPIDTDNSVFEELLSSARAKHAIKYSWGKAIVTSEIKNAFFYSREVLPRVASGEFTLSETAIRDFLQTYRKELPNVTAPSKDGISFVAEDVCVIEDVALGGQKAFDPGPFECEIFEYSLDQKYLDYLYENISFGRLIDRDEYRNLVDRFHGIKVVRDGFIIQGFGDGDGGDWLGLSSSSKTTGYFFDMRNDSVIGCVYLSGLNNASLKETTNREGFVEDDYFRVFKSILEDAVKRINRNRKKINDLMRKYVANTLAHTANPSDDVLIYKSTIAQIKSDLNKVNSSIVAKTEHLFAALEEARTTKKMIAEIPFVPDETVSGVEQLYQNLQIASDEYRMLLKERELLSQKLDLISLDFDKMSERIQDLFELAGLGISVELFAHEFDASIRSVRSKNQQVVSNQGEQTVEGLIRHINYVTHSLDALRKQMSYFNPGLKFVRVEKQVFSISDFIKSHKQFYADRCHNKDIVFNAEIEIDFEVRLNRGMLNQVFDNLFSNSEYWLDYAMEHGVIDHKEYTISIKEKGFIVVWDNGLGISRDMETRLFDPFETKKKNGRGLGLYIAAGNLKYSDSRLRLLNERNHFGNLFKFEIDVSQVVR